MLYMLGLLTHVDDLIVTIKMLYKNLSADMEHLPQEVVTGMLTCGTETIRRGYTRFLFRFCIE